jgi:hypothetical protein
MIELLIVLAVVVGVVPVAKRSLILGTVAITIGGAILAWRGHSTLFIGLVTGFLLAGALAQRLLDRMLSRLVENDGQLRPSSPEARRR